MIVRVQHAVVVVGVVRASVKLQTFGDSCTRCCVPRRSPDDVRTGAVTWTESRRCQSGAIEIVEGAADVEAAAAVAERVIVVWTRIRTSVGLCTPG